MTLQISRSLSLPLTFVTSTQAILAKKRVGKSYTAQVQAEELLEHKQQSLVIDPTSAWWGLRSSAEGDKPGFPIAVFGGDHGDADLPAGSGAAMARAAVEEGFSAIFDLSLLELDEAVVWAKDFGATLYRLNRHAVHLFVDEADMFIPQTPSTKDEHRCLKLYDTIVRRGGIKGIGTTLICQRSALLNKNVLSQVDMLTVLRMHHPLDLEPVETWVKKKGDPERAKKMIESLPGLALGEAWAWNPEIDLFDKIVIRRKRTFDSGRTPAPGERKTPPKVLAQIDIQRLGASVAAAVERAKASDPAVLQQRIRELETRLATLANTQPELPPVLDHAAWERAYEAGARVQLDSAQKQVAIYLADLGVRLDHVREILSAPQLAPIQPPGRDAYAERAAARLPAAKQPPKPAPAPLKPRRSTAPGGTALDGAQQKLVNVLASLSMAQIYDATPDLIAALAGYSVNTKSYKNARGALHSAGLVEYGIGGHMSLTSRGVDHVSSSQGLRRAEWHDQLFGILDGPEAKILRCLVPASSGTLDRVTLASAAGYSENTKSFKNALGRLRSLGLVEYPTKGAVRIVGQVFYPRGCL